MVSAWLSASAMDTGTDPGLGKDIHDPPPSSLRHSPSRLPAKRMLGLERCWASAKTSPWLPPICTGRHDLPPFSLASNPAAVPRKIFSGLLGFPTSAWISLLGKAI